VGEGALPALEPRKSDFLCPDEVPAAFSERASYLLKSPCFIPYHGRGLFFFAAEMACPVRAAWDQKAVSV
jgi:hypothetical protein